MLERFFGPRRREKENSAVLIGSIPQERKAEMSKLIRESGGRAAILVHPYYFRSADYPAEKDFQRRVAYFLNHSKLPVFVLHNTWGEDELDFILSNPQTISRVTGGKRNRLVLLTGESQEPILYAKNPFLVDSKQKKLCELLQELGVKRLQVGGMYSMEDASDRERNSRIAAIEGKWVKNGMPEGYIPISGGCAGRTYANILLSGKVGMVTLMPNLLHTEKPAYVNRKRDAG